MKKGLNKFRFLNIILVAVIAMELIFIVDSGIVGNAVKSVTKSAAVGTVKTATVKAPTCTPTKEICDGKDNDCDNVVDEEGVC